MNVFASLEIKCDFYVEGWIEYQNVDSCFSTLLYNQGYKIDIEGANLISNSSDYSDCVKAIEVNHNGTFKVFFNGFVDVPEKMALIKTEDYLEVNGNCAVTPIFKEFPHADYKVLVKIPDDFGIVGFDKIEENKYVRYDINACHVAFIVYRNNLVQSFCQDNVTVIAGKHYDSNKLKEMCKICLDVINEYKTFLGMNRYRSYYIVVNPRNYNGAYVEGNIISLVDRIEGLDIDTFLHLAHEISHFWWNNCLLNNNNRWIAETFAQYSALMLIRDKYGENEFMKIINGFKNQTIKMPSLSSIDDQTESNVVFSIHYYKGPYLFYKLEQELGREKMKRLFYKCHKEQIKTSDDFLKICPEFTKYYEM